ncbi:MAG: hypothetical protein FWB97_05930 [Oscillospiraceae bacterium]|nr:hypothetical protein [Oscillospiraceae bacterium]
MNGLDRVVEYIRTDTDKECIEISRISSEECEQLKADYLSLEQERYWKAINEGTKAAEQRLESLSALAATEAKKQYTLMQQELLDEAFACAAGIIKGLTDEEFSILLRKVGSPPGISADELVEQYKEKLSRTVMSMLFD